MSLKIDRKDLRDWMFRGLLFEAEAEQFRAAGIRVGADESASERALFEETLDPFSIDLRNEALQMARLYALVYCFENSVRALIEERLQERHGLDWWEKRNPSQDQRPFGWAKEGCSGQLMVGGSKQGPIELCGIRPFVGHHCCKLGRLS